MIIDYLKSYEYRLFFLVCFTTVGLVTSKSVMSIGVTAMFANMLLDFVLNPKEIKNVVPHFFNQKKLLVLVFVFFTSLLAWSYSSNVSVGGQFVLNKLPFLVVPFAFSWVKNISTKQFHFLLGFFVTTIFISGVVVSVNYLQNYEALNYAIKKGKAIWVPFNHIRYSVMLVFAFCTSLYLAFNYFKKDLKLFIFFAIVGVFLFGLVHILSVRSGLLVLYISLAFALFYYIFKTKNYKLMVLGFLVLFSLPILAYQLIPNVKNKISYMKYDWEQFQNNNIGSNSDSRRLISYKAGFSILKQNMPLGLGTGSLQDAMNMYYETNHPEMLARDRIAPHNQFLFTLLDCGLLGLFALLTALFYPLLGLKFKKEHLLYLLFWISACIPLIYDISLERQLGITYFILFSSLFIKRISLEDAKK